jgi:hypothetical protein
MKKPTILLMIAAISAPAFAGIPGPNKKAVAAMTPEVRESCATTFVSFARAGKKGNEMSVARDGRSPEEAKKFDVVGDVFELRGHQYLNANAKISDPLPKTVDDAANASVARLLGDNDAFNAIMEAIKTCDTTSGTEPIDIGKLLSGN